MSFVHLHTHTHYSILEWLPKPAQYIKKAIALGMPWVAITDTGNIHGCHEFYKYAKEGWIKPILWSEIIIESPLDPKLTHKLVLLSKNMAWYHNLLEIITSSHLDKHALWAGVVSFKNLKKYRENLICLSGPIWSEIWYSILSWRNDEEIKRRIELYQDLFWKENYFLELLHHPDIPKQDLVTERLIELHKKYNIPVVAANNSYYINKEDKSTQDIIKCLWTWHELENPDRPSLMQGDYSFLSSEEMQGLFWYIPEALENTVKILDRVNIEIETGRILMPWFDLNPEDQELYNSFINETKDDTTLKTLWSDEFYLRYICFYWMDYRYDIHFSKEEIFEFIKKKDIVWLEKKLQDTQPDELKLIPKKYFTEKKKTLLETYSSDWLDKMDRLEYELFVVHEMWFDAYFLIVSDYIMWAKKQWIPVGPWRGSAAWSILAYLSWITDLDPLAYDLLFERFLNPARISMPDIDTDFSDDERDSVVEYCRQKYGADRVAQICTFGTFAARAAVKDVGRVMGVSFAEMNEMAKVIPEKPGIKLAKALEEAIEFKTLYETNKTAKKIIDEALKIEGNVRQLWVHACAVIIASEKLTHFTALQHPPKDDESIVTQYSAYPLEDLGLLKMDFLWLRNLTIIKRALRIIKKEKNIEIDILKIPLDDTKVFEIFANGDTTWVFQFESDGMRQWLKNLKPTDINDIIAMVSLYRPGPMQFIQNYIDRKYGKEAINYMYEDLAVVLKKKYGEATVVEEKRKLHEDLWSFMDITYGIAVYQEQLMRLVQAMAWFSLAEADMLRRWVWKKKKDVIEKIMHEFIAKAESYKGYKPETSQTIYEKMIMPAADYSFNKSHAACYAFIAYETAYLKAHYKTEFLTSMMTSDEENIDRIALEVLEAKSKNINILPPSVNSSRKHFTYIDDNTIRFWLKAIKWLWDGPIDKIINERKNLPNKKFTTLEEFIEITWKEVINKKSLESLIKSWSLDELWDRSEMLWNIDEMTRFMRSADKEKNTPQIGLFDSIDDMKDILLMKKTEILSFEEKLFWEKEVLGFMVSGHPLDGLKRYINKRSTHVKMLKLPLIEIKRQYEKKWNEEEKKKYLDSLRMYSTLVWVVVDFRKTITKNGKNMVFLYCESFDFDFEAIIYDKDYLTYINQIETWKIVIIEWMSNVDIHYNKKNIQIKKMKIASLTQVRAQAKDSWLFDDSKRMLFEEDIAMESLSDEKTEIKSKKEENFVMVESPVDFENNSEEISKYIIDIPLTATKKDLLDLKEFLSNEDNGHIDIFIYFKGQEIDTKVRLSSLYNLNNWIVDRWKK